MGFDWVRLFNFRNLGDGKIDIAAPQVFLIGENGQGKSNFLESLYYLSYGGSFRTRHDQEVCRHGEDQMALDGFFTSREDRFRMEVRYEESRKTLHRDGKTIQDRKDMVSLIPTVVFRHGDMDFVSGSPEKQRWFVDQTLSMNYPLYIDDLRRYRKILKNRNQLLKSHDYEMISVYDYHLAEAGLSLQRRREDVLRSFNHVFSQEFRYIAGLSEDLTIEYQASWKGCKTIEDVLEILAKNHARERVLRTTTSGPHRDKFFFRYGDRDFLSLASTGQVRLVSLILRVAQARFFLKETGRLPLLLLDDVLLELDGLRRDRFISRLPPAEQRLFTFLPGNIFRDYRTEETMVYTISDGRFQRE
ncbi:DNA replication and repair protein RecF [Alkalispirochaeta americana]|uniref:DNA replication and repair protein RecF n=1 Tax=Alkalispirochaeta americana TaxID=159291 RepID=A0A1N6QCE0_9SPIO|nr:DNA replication and repair protein RecF [Alkalispirochaeta americana]SIQ14271.1 DNA replication and repair protein RecF [Alkalispirochaeta americana]